MTRSLAESGRWLLPLLLPALCLAQEAGDVERGDFNFDGHEDYRIFVMHNGRKADWNYFLFNPSTREYGRSSELEALWNPRFDRQTRTIHTYWNLGHAGQIFVRESYTWMEGRLKLMEQVKQDWDEGKKLYYRVNLRRVDGEMTLVNVSLMTDAEVLR